MGLNGLLCHTIIAAVANNVLLVGENFVTKNVHLVLRCSLHLLIASLLFYQELPKFKDTYFAYLGLPITSTHSDVLKSYDKIQEFLKTGAPDVVAKVKRAYQVLSNQESRLLYSVYGDIDIEAKNPQDFTLIILTVSLSYYVVSSIVCCALNRSNRLKFARYVSVLYNAIGFFLEIELRFLYSGFMKNVFYLKKLLPYQHVEFLRAVPPFVMMVTSLITHFFVTDFDKVNLFLWQSTVATNNVILEKMANVVKAIEYLQSLGKDLKRSDDFQKGDEKDDNSEELLDSLNEDQKKRLMELLENNNGKDKKGKSKFWEFLKPMAIYFVMFLIVRIFSK